MFATLEKATNVNTNNESRFENSSRIAELADFSDDVVTEALRRAALIRQSWSEEEIAQRKQVGEARRDMLNLILATTV